MRTSTQTSPAAPAFRYETWTARPLRQRRAARRPKRALTLLQIGALVAGVVVAITSQPQVAQAAGTGEPTQISAGGDHTCSVTAAGQAYCWGRNTHGQLGNGSTTQRAEPVAVSGLSSGVSQISAGGDHTCAVTTDASLYCWGRNDAGQLGDGTTSRRLTPVLVALTGVTQVSAGMGHTCARTSSSQAYCWGAGTNGRIGNGSTLNRSTPTLVSLSSVTQISAGFSHTCAVRSGAAWCWGDNSDRQIGNGSSTSNILTPVQVSSLSSVTHVDAGTSHSCARRSAGTVHCWGDNMVGQLGDGTVIDRPTPVQVAGLSGATQVTAGAGHSCAATTNGIAHCWGDNGVAQLGDGTTGGVRTTAAPVANLAASTRVDAGGLHTCSVSSDFRAHCWGMGSSGQLGDGLAVLVRTTPQRVLILVPPTLVAPVPNYRFEAGETQLFRAEAPNPDHAYIAEVEVESVINGDSFVFTIGPAPAGQDAVGSPPVPLDADSYRWRASWSEVDESGVIRGFSEPSGFQDFQVATNFACDAADAIVDGYVDSTYLRLAVDQSVDSVSVCQIVDDGVNAGGVVTVSAPGSLSPPTVTTSTTACSTATSPLPEPLLEGEVGPPSDPLRHVKYYADITMVGNEVRVCVKMGNEGTDNNLVERTITMVVPDEGAVPQVSFAPYSGSIDAPPPAPHDDLTQPSALCQVATSGTRTQILNIAIDGVRLYAYTLRDADEAYSCVRVKGQGGLLAGIDVEGVPGVSPVLTAGPSGPAASNPDCPVQEIHNTSPVILDVYHSALPSNPVAVCAQIHTSSLITKVGSAGSLVLPDPVLERDS